MRRGLGIGRGKGYRNIIGRDSQIHSASAKGIKQPQSIFSGIFMARSPLKLAHVNINRYVGKWYQIAAKPAPFQNGCGNVTAEYSLVRSKAGVTLRVKNSCVRNGKTETVYGNATPTKLDGRFIVKFDNIPFSTGNYNVLYVDDDYDYALVGSDDRKYLWILSRRPTIPKSVYQTMLLRAQNQEFDTSDVK